ncbi:MAG: alpha-galactosidase [Limisphaerales bacterium]
MKPNILTGLLLAAAVAVRAADFETTTATGPVITVTTAHSALTLCVGADKRLYEIHYGKPRPRPAPSLALARETEFYPQYGDGFILEPALAVTHADGNTSTDLNYIRHTRRALSPDVSLTRIDLKDPAYPLRVTLYFKAYSKEDVIEEWSDIRNDEHRPVMLSHFASAAPLFRADTYWLTQFSGDYWREATMYQEKLGPGMKILDSKIGVRADRFCIPSFILSLNGPASEENGEVIGGSLEWSGSFQFVFDVDWKNRLRVLSGINPFEEQYKLNPGETFTTPGMLWTWSDSGKGQVSRNFHNWARRYGIRDGFKSRPVLLNNWEATGFHFDEDTLVSLFDGAREIGADTFLLDDGWFGNAHPRNNDDAGLGDWQVNTNKLPRGLSYLTRQAHERGINFGIWIEPEMVNPKSDLFERHRDWVICQPHRPLTLSRNQLDLDLSNPAVQQFVWESVSNVLSTPGINFVKWDCNRFVTQPGSPYLPADEQSELLIRYNWALYKIMSKMAGTFPDIMAMACSGGGGRVDYGSMKYFDTFWPSDDTDPLNRVKIQWGYSHFFPAETITAHITTTGHRPLKFTMDVAMSGALGVDMDLRKLPPDQVRQLADGIALYKSRIQNIVEQGDLYRLESPYDHPRAAMDYVSPDKSSAALFVYQIADGSPMAIHLRGLDPDKSYRIREVNLPAGQASRLAAEGQMMLGADLMGGGIVPPCQKQFDSSVILLTEEK